MKNFLNRYLGTDIGSSINKMSSPYQQWSNVVSLRTMNSLEGFEFAMMSSYENSIFDRITVSKPYNEKEKSINAEKLISFFKSNGFNYMDTTKEGIIIMKDVDFLAEITFESAPSRIVIRFHKKNVGIVYDEYEDNIKTIEILKNRQLGGI